MCEKSTPKELINPHVLIIVKWTRTTCMQANHPPSGGGPRFCVEVLEMMLVSCAKELTLDSFISPTFSEASIAASEPYSSMSCMTPDV